MNDVKFLFSGIEIFDDFSYVSVMLTDLGMRKKATGAAMHRQTNNIISILQNLKKIKMKKINLSDEFSNSLHAD